MPKLCSSPVFAKIKRCRGNMIVYKGWTINFYWFPQAEMSSSSKHSGNKFNVDKFSHSKYVKH